jgi:transcriptional regulator GlxA family with amidase domain
MMIVLAGMTDDRAILPNQMIKPVRVFILAYDGVQILDIAGPSAVFEETAEFVEGIPYRVVLVSSSGGEVTTSGAMTLGTAALSTQSIGDCDMLLVPGGNQSGLRRLIASAETRDWVREHATAFCRIASVCTGAFALADWGLLDGRCAATHWQASALLAQRYPSTIVDAAALFVEDGQIWTSAGVSAGVDMALAIVERDHGRTIATQVARRLVLPMRRPGHQSQFSDMLEAQDGEYAQLVEWAKGNLDKNLSLEALALRAGQSPRNFHRRFKATIGVTPTAFIERLRIDHARTLLEAAHLPKSAAKASGFGSLDHMARVFKKTVGMTPSLYRAIHSS